MRFYGVGSEERLSEIISSINGGEWIFEDLKQENREVLNGELARERLWEILLEIRKWKEEFSTLAKGTIFVFVHEPENPRAFKIYDTSSLGCSTSLTPPRWRLYRKELEGSEGL
jgi:hypothetical protein